MLRLVFNEARFQPVDLDQPRLTVGRAAENLLVLDSAEISSFHAEILNDGQGVWVRDCDSTNGTWLNGMRIRQQQALQAGMEIRFSNHAARIVVRPAPQTAAGHGWLLTGPIDADDTDRHLVERTMVVGRSADADIVIAQANVSRRHAELRLEHGRLLLRDLGSSNGTCVNGRRVSEVELAPGDEVRFATSGFRVEISTTRAAAGHRDVAPSAYQAPAVLTPPKLGFHCGDAFVPFAGTRLQVGRTADNDLCFDDPTISGRHALITFQTGSWVLEDLGSLNGTFVNGQRITKTVLQNNDRVTFGTFQVIFSGLAPRQPATTPSVVIRIEA